MPYEETEIPSMEQTTKQTEIQRVLEGIRNSNVSLHENIEQLIVRLNSVLKEEQEKAKEKEVEVYPPFITKLARQFDEEDWKIKTAIKKIKRLMDRLEI